MTYTIQRYPVELIDVIELGNGRRVTLRPVLPQDEAVTQAFVRSLSPTSRNYRFMRGLRELSANLLHGLTSVDYRSNLALLAEVFDDGVEVVVAEARYIVEPDYESAEFAVAVADAWRGMGLAATLLRRLQDHASVAGIRRITGETLASNDRVVRFARKAGFSIKPDREIAGLLRLQLEIGQRP